MHTIIATYKSVELIICELLIVDWQFHTFPRNHCGFPVILSQCTSLIHADSAPDVSDAHRFVYYSRAYYDNNNASCNKYNRWC